MEKINHADSKMKAREMTPYYISAGQADIEAMLAELGLNSLEGLFEHLPESAKMGEMKQVLPRLEYDDLRKHMQDIAAKNKLYTAFLGDGLPVYKIPSVTLDIAQIRGLTTAYTPYQPERSQGTLIGLWIYASTLAKLTGFEAINASFYDRSTALYEAFNTALRLKRGRNTVVVSEGLFPGDLAVIKTLAKETTLKLVTIPVDNKTGRLNIDTVKITLEAHNETLAAFAFTQVNSLGLIEDFNELTDLCRQKNIQSIGVIDPFHIATGGLRPPATWGELKEGVDMFVAEGQHLGLAPHFGGPGLGVFGIRYNDNNKISIRSTAGRFLGKTIDREGTEAFCMVLSTREQHIRREKATSNICSNQSFVATLAGAGLLARGEAGMENAAKTAHSNAQEMAAKLSSFSGIKLAFPQAAFWNQITLEIDKSLPLTVEELLAKAQTKAIHLGVNTSLRLNKELDGKKLLMISFSDLQSKTDLKKLEDFFNDNFKKNNSQITLPTPAESMMRKIPAGLPKAKSDQEILSYYQALGDQNVSPDDGLYPLGSCTMKYNPEINDYAASLPGFAHLHPEVPSSDAQGSLEVLYQIQEMFKDITGLPGVTTQPMAGAQGELIGLKMFQAYYRDQGEIEKRDIILIPISAHGTNPASATMAGIETVTTPGKEKGIVTIKANEHGQMDFEELKSHVLKFGERIMGVMVTNPNTSGLFESEFKAMADLIHSVGGLVYMDGANMNAIAGWVDLEKLGVDAVHNNLHKTWSIPHGGGGPGDAIVAVSQKLIPYLPGDQVKKTDTGKYECFKTEKSIGECHRHMGNFGHKIRCYTYLRALGPEGIKKMSAVAVLSARYLFHHLKDLYPTLPAKSKTPRMHEFIITLSKESFDRLQASGTPKAQAIARIGKLFLDFGLHAPTVAFPEALGLMIEPTESFSKSELDDFIAVVKALHGLIHENPEVLLTTPHFTPVKKVDEVLANKNLILWESLDQLPKIRPNIIHPGKLRNMELPAVIQLILVAHNEAHGISH